jgi:hypothetical protein
VRILKSFLWKILKMDLFRCDRVHGRQWRWTHISEERKVVPQGNRQCRVCGKGRSEWNRGHSLQQIDAFPIRGSRQSHGVDQTKRISRKLM